MVSLKHAARVAPPITYVLGALAAMRPIRVRLLQTHPSRNELRLPLLFARASSAAVKLQRKSRPSSGLCAQVCTEDCVLPISLTHQDGSVTTGTFTSPVVTSSGCPALLGLKALQDQKAILDLSKRQLHFVGQGEPTLVLPPGSETFQLEAAMSGHLLLPCTSSAPATAGEHHLCR